MVKFFARAEIRHAFVDELVNIPARTKDGRQLPAMSFQKRYYNAEIDGEPVLLRVRDDVAEKVPRNLVKGDDVSVSFSTVEVEGDVSQIYVLGIEKAKK